MHKIARPYRATLRVAEFAAGCGFAGIAFRLFLMPIGLVDKTSALIVAEGGLNWFFASAVVFGLMAGVTGALIAIAYNQIAWRARA
jgi:hypothetical protein